MHQREFVSILTQFSNCETEYDTGPALETCLLMGLQTGVMESGYLQGTSHGAGQGTSADLELIYIVGHQLATLCGQCQVTDVYNYRVPTS